MTTSNDKLARLAGLLYLILLPTAEFGMFGAAGLVVPGDPAATLAHIQASRTLFEFAIILGAVGFIDFLAVGLALYKLFSNADKGAAGLMLAFVAASVPLSLAAIAGRIDVLSLPDAARGISALGGDHLQVQVMLALRHSDNLMRTSLIFWGLWLFPLGWLVLRSGFTPRTLGVLLMVGGFFYLFIFVGTVFNPAYETTRLAGIVGVVSGAPGQIGELGTALWLLIMGARERRAAVRPEALGVTSLSAATR
jgi:hypothetical protein